MGVFARWAFAAAEQRALGEGYAEAQNYSSSKLNLDSDFEQSIVARAVSTGRLNPRATRQSSMGLSR
jgi:hypothetical protein